MTCGQKPPCHVLLMWQYVAIFCSIIFRPISYPNSNNLFKIAFCLKCFSKTKHFHIYVAICCNILSKWFLGLFGIICFCFFQDSHWVTKNHLILSQKIIFCWKLYFISNVTNMMSNMSKHFNINVTIHCNILS